MSRRLATAAAVLALSLSACGGDDNGGDPMSAAELRAEVNRICREDTKAAQKFAKPTSDEEEYARQLEGLLEINDRSRKRFDELEPPEELRDAYEDFLRANDEGVAHTKRIVERLKRGEDRTKVFSGETGEKIVLIGRRRTEAARRLGTPACGSRA